MGLAECTIPGGEYGRAKLDNWEDHIPEIGRTFERMARECERDPRRPSVEFYRSQKELVLLFPVKGSGRARLRIRRRDSRASRSSRRLDS